VVQTFDIDAVVDTGDMVDWGSNAETNYVTSIPSVGVPYIYVRGNHDSDLIQSAVARQRGAVVLDNKITTIDGLTIAGIGDPQFTPDKSTSADGDAPDSSLFTAGETLATTIEKSKTKVDIAMVHDPAMVPPLNGRVPLVLAGHLHHREVSILPAPSPAPQASGASATPTPTASADGAAAGPMQTRLMVQGSTGGAGLRGLEKDKPTPLTLTVLYFDEKNQLKAYDEIELGGTGESNIEMQRHVIGAQPPENPSESAAPAGR
jgi:predicted phosphodiesterase